MIHRRRLAAVVLVGLSTFACTRGGGDGDLSEFASDAPPPGITERHLDFGGKVELVGWTMTPEQREYAVGDRVTLTFVWKVAAPMEPGFRFFTHLVTPSGQMVANIDADGPLRQKEGAAPEAAVLARMKPGKYYRDTLTLLVVPGTPRVVNVVAGIYRGNERLQVTANGASVGPELTVTRMVVASPAAPNRAVIKELAAPKLAASAALRIDGRLDEPEWAKAADTGPFVDVGSGQPNPYIPVQGSVKLLWDDRFLYAGFSVLDKKVHGGWPAGAKDPHLWEKDTVEIMIDPDGDGDNKDYYEIQINPQNLVFDTQYDDYNSPNGNGRGPFGHEEWSAGLTSAVVVRGTIDNDADTDEGYSVEAKIPWASFTKAQKVPPAPDSTWRMNFYAMKNNGGVAWSPILGQGNFHRASRFGRVRWAAGGGAASTADGGK